MADKEGSIAAILKDTLALVLITLVAAVLLGLVRDVTAGPIAEREEREKQEAYLKVFPGAVSVEDSGVNAELKAALEKASDILGEEYNKAVKINEACIAKDAEGNLLGYILTVTDKKGYGGDIRMAFGYGLDGTIRGIAFLAIGETAGFGLEAEKNPEWRTQYYGKNVDSFSVTKTGAAAENEIDALSGATITSKAVTGGINGGLRFAGYLSEQGIGGAR